MSMAMKIKETVQELDVWRIVVTLMLVGLMSLSLIPMEPQLGRNDMLLLNGITTFSFCAIGISIFRKKRIIINVIDCSVLSLFLCYSLNTYIVSRTPCATVFLKNCQWMILYLSLRLMLTESRRIIGVIIPILCTACGLFEVAQGMAQILGLEQSRHIMWLITGSFNNPGPYGCYLAVMLSIATAAYVKTHNKWYGYAILPLLVMLPSTWSRASILSYILVIGILYLDIWKRYWKIIVIAVVVIASALYIIKRRSADGRMFMLYMSLKVFADNLFTGVGTGGYLDSIGETTADYFVKNPTSLFVNIVGVPDHTFCEPMRIAVEQGGIGLLLFTTVIVLSIKTLLMEKSPIAYGLLSLVAFSFFSYPFSITSFCILATIFVAAAATFSRDNKFRCKKSWKYVLLIFPVALVVFVNNNLRYRIENSEDYHRFEGIKNGSFIDDYYELRPSMNDNVSFLFNFGALLRDNGRYNDSNDMLRQGSELSADPMFEILMGRNYEDLKKYDIADSLYTKAFFMQPNRLYPLYRQMKLYEQMNDSERLRNKAKEILDFNPKVNSPATEDMKNEAQKNQVLTIDIINSI